MLLLLTLCSLSGVGQVKATETNIQPTALLTTNSPFVRHLSAQPWIRHIRFVEGMHIQVGNQIGDPFIMDMWQNQTNVAALQPSGMMIERLTFPDFTERARNGNREARGISDKYCWIVSTAFSQLVLSPIRETEGGSPNNGPQRVMRMLRDNLERIRNLGLPPLTPGSFKLHDANRFTTITSEGEQLNGIIKTATNDRPLALAFDVGTNPVRHVSVTYKYISPEAALPDYFVFDEERNGKPYLLRTNWILLADYGLDGSVSNGYSPSSLFTNLSSLTRIQLWSNAVVYSVASDGRLKAIVNHPYVLPPELTGKARFPLPLLAGIIFLTAGGLFVLKVTRREKQTNNTTI